METFVMLVKFKQHKEDVLSRDVSFLQELISKIAKSLIVVP
jgi:hypothetical protein